MTSTLRSLFLASSLAVASAAGVTVVQPVAFAQAPSKPDVAEASRHFSRGVDFAKDGAYDAALAEFRRAYAIVPNYRVLFNIAQTQAALHDYAGALATMQKYLADGGKEIPAARRADAEAEIQKFQGSVGHLAITANAPDTTIAIDDEPVGKAPLDDVVVNVGHRKVTATHDGQSVTRTVEIAGGDRASVALEVPTAAPTAPPAPSAAPAATPSTTGPTPTAPPAAIRDAPAETPNHTPMIAAWTVTGVCAAFALITGAFAQGASNELAKDRGTEGITASQLSAAQSRTKTYSVVSDVLTGAALAAAGVAVYFTIWPPTSRAAPSAGLTVGPGWAGVQGAF